MKDKAEFWLQLFLSAILPYLLGSGGIYLLVQFREQLPEHLYAIFLYIIYTVFVVVLIRLAFGNWLNKFYINIQKLLRHRAEKKIVHEWYEKWRDLCRLMQKVIKNNWQPTKKQNDAYSKLRFWFITNRSKFLPVWHGFNTWRSEAANEDKFNGTTSLKWRVFRENYKDPFSYFYEPFRLEDLGHILGLGYNKPDVGDMLIKLLELLHECTEWTSLKR
jgi:hypothetical protein